MPVNNTQMTNRSFLFNRPYQDRKRKKLPKEYIGGGEALRKLDIEPNFPVKDKALKSLKGMLEAEEKGEELSPAKVYRLQSSLSMLWIRFLLAIVIPLGRAHSRWCRSRSSSAA